MANYWQGQLRSAEHNLNRVDLNSWFDLWHTHIDWRSKGNRSLETRLAAANLTYTVLQLAENKAKERTAPIQVWAICCTNTADNAIYYHTPNDNGSEYPYAFEGVAWGIIPSNELKFVSVSPNYEWGVYTAPDNEILYFLRSRT
jgi:hypothetical protein